MGCFKPVKELRFPVRAALRRAVPHPRAGHRLYIPCKEAAVDLDSLVIYNTSHDLFLFSFLLFFSLIVGLWGNTPQTVLILNVFTSHPLYGLT